MKPFTWKKTNKEFFIKIFSLVWIDVALSSQKVVCSVRLSVTVLFKTLINAVTSSILDFGLAMQKHTTKSEKQLPSQDIKARDRKQRWKEKK